MTVRLTALDGAQTAVVHDKGALVVDGSGGTWRSLVAREISDGHYRVWGRTDANVCPAAGLDLGNPANGWTVVAADQPGIGDVPTADRHQRQRRIRATSSASANRRRVACATTAARSAPSTASAGANRTVNQVPLEQYLRSVVGGEVSYGWASLGRWQGRAGAAGAGRCRSQLRPRREPRAVREDVRQRLPDLSRRCVPGRRDRRVRRPGVRARPTRRWPRRPAWCAEYGSPSGAIAYTMFSSSSGGFTATNTLGFTPVVDEGDAVAGNAGHTWATTIDAEPIQATYPSIGTFTGIAVTSRDGNGEWGGRVLVDDRRAARPASVNGHRRRVPQRVRPEVELVPGAGRCRLRRRLRHRREIRAPGARPPLVAGHHRQHIGAVGSRRSRRRGLVDTRIGVGTAAVADRCRLHAGGRSARSRWLDRRRRQRHRGRAGDERVPHRVPVRRREAAGIDRAGRRRPHRARHRDRAARMLDGKFCVFASTTTELVIDLSGVYGTDSRRPLRADRRAAALRLPHRRAGRRAASSCGCPSPGSTASRRRRRRSR